MDDDDPVVQEVTNYDLVFNKRGINSGYVDVFRFIALKSYITLQIPVYLSRTLAKNLYIYQYPARPANRDWSDVQIVNAALKPKNQVVRLEVGLDTNSDKFCSSVAEQIAINTDGHQVCEYSVLHTTYLPNI